MEVDGIAEPFAISEASRCALESLDDAVEAFEPCVGEAEFLRSYHAGQVVSQRRHRSLGRFRATT